MVRNNYVTDVFNINKKIACDDYFLFYVKDKEYKEKAFFIILNDGLFSVFKADSQTIIQNEISLSEYEKEIFIPNIEKAVEIVSFSVDSEKHNKNLDVLGSYYFYLVIRTNLGTKMSFDVEIKNFGDKLILSYNGITDFNALWGNIVVSKINYKYNEFGSKTQNSIKVSFDCGKYFYGDNSINRPDLSVFNTELTTVKNFFSNLHNYTTMGWGGVGTPKDLKALSGRTGLTKKGIYNNSVVGLIAGGSDVVWGAELKGTNTDYTAFTTDTSLPPTYTGVMPSDDELFDMMFNRAEKMFFIPPTISSTKNGNDLKFNDNVSVDLVDDFIFLYIELGKKIKE